MRKRTNAATWVYLVSGMICFGSGTPVSKLVTSAFPVFVASGFRMLVAMLLLWPFLLLTRKDQLQKIRPNTWGLLAAIGFFGMFLFSLAMLYGMKIVSGATGSIIMSTMPAVVAVASVVFMGDRVTPLKTGAILLAVGGLLIIHMGLGGASDGGDGAHIIVGSRLVFGAVCCESAYTLLGKKAMETLDAVAIAGITSTLAMLLFLPVLIWQWHEVQWSDLHWQDWLALAWWGAGTLGLGTVLWYRGVKEVKGSVAAGFMGVMPLSALVLSYVLLNEQFEWIHAIGMALELVAIGLMAWAQEKNK